MAEQQKKNPMQEVSIEKVVLNIGANGEKLEKAVKLLKILIPGRNPSKMRSRRRIPSLGVRPGLEVGAVVTIRENTEETLKRMLSAVDNKIRRKQISTNNFSFGIKEYIEVPGMEYQRDIGIMGFDVTVVFKRAGRRVRLKKVKQGRIPARQHITPEEIISFMETKYNTTFN